MEYFIFKALSTSEKYIDILYVVNNAAFFVSHRLPVALAARRHGYSIGLLVGQAGSLSMETGANLKLEDANLTYQKISFSSTGMNPVRESVGLIELIVKAARIRPELMHCISPKGIIYGGIAARILRTKSLVMAISGMGFIFTDGGGSNKLRKLISYIYIQLFKFVLRHPNLRVIVQNEDDMRTIANIGSLTADKIVLIPGSGVQLERFIHAEIKQKEPIVLMPARMLWDKGVGEFIEAASQLKALVPEWRFLMAGAADYKNPTSLSPDLLEEICLNSGIEWVGHQDDMSAYFARASIVCLPSYREGMPKCLLEGAASGCAIVTSDAIGCRESILPNVTGLLVPVRDSEALKVALYTLITNKELRESFGREGREWAIKRFSLDNVINQTLSIYRELIIHEG